MMQSKEVFEESVLFIGPIGVGKTTLAKRLENKMGLYYFSIDDMRKFYSSKFDYNYNKGKQLELAKDYLAWYDYQKEFSQKLACNFLQNLTEPAIIDFGAVHSVFNDKKLFEKIRESFKPFKNVIYLKLPKNYKETHERAKHALNEIFINSNCNEILATKTIESDFLKKNAEKVYFDEYRIESILQEIIKKIREQEKTEDRIHLI